MRHVLLVVGHRTQEIKPNHTASFIDSNHLVSANVTLAEVSCMAKTSITEWEVCSVLHNSNNVCGKVDGGMTL